MSGRELYKIMIKNDLDFVIDKIIEKNNNLTIKELKIEELEQKVEQLEKENKILKENAEHNDKVVDKVNWKNMLLNNIINELEKRLEFDSKDEENHGYCEPYIDGCRDEATIILDYLKQLKENNKNV